MALELNWTTGFNDSETECVFLFLVFIILVRFSLYENKAVSSTQESKLFQLGHCPYLLGKIRHLKVSWSMEKIIRVLETLWVLKSFL